MENLELGKKYIIHSYKHNSKIHRAWDEAVLLEIHDDYLIFGNERTKVTESDGRTWRTKEPAVLYFFKNKWYNIIGQYKKDGIYYYCNIASPSLYDGEAIKNIDYDLDVKVFPDGEYMILDENEYEYHASVMNYPKNIKDIIELELQDLLNLVKNKKEPFDFSYINDYIMKYFGLNNND